MLYKLSVEEAPTLKDLLDQVAAAIDGLGKDAQWTGHKDGCVYLWRKDKDTGVGIKPNTKHGCNIVWREMTE